MTAQVGGYRAMIVDRLNARDRECVQFGRVFESYATLCEAFESLSAKNSSGGGGNRCSLKTDHAAQRLNEANAELSELYKRKAINDEALIDANRRIAQLESRLSVIINDRNDAKSRLELLRQQIVSSSRKAIELRDKNLLLKSIFDTTQEDFQRANQEYMAVDLERLALIDEIKKIKEQQIAKMNEQNEILEKKRLEKITNDLADAVRTHKPVTRKLTQLAVEISSHAAGSSTAALGTGDETSDDSIEHIGDVIPMRCQAKLEVDDIGEVSDCLFHPNGRMFFTAGSDKTVRVFEMVSDFTITKKSVLSGANQGVNRLAIDAECGLLAAASGDKTVRVWSILDRRLRVTLSGHTDKVVAARFVNAGKMITSGSADRNIKLFDIVGNRCVHTYFPGSIVLDMAINDRHSAPVISSHCDKSVRFYDLRANSPANVMKFGRKVSSLFADGENRLLCSCRDETLSLVDLRNNAIIHCYSAESYRTSSDYSKCVISPNGSYIAAGSADGHLYVWNALTTKLEKVLHKNAHDGTPILSLAWHPRGQALISGDKRKTLCVWT